jgi:hypothetical protein
VTAVLVVRAWLEEHETAPLRAVITRVPDVLQDAVPPLSASSREEVLAAVSAWLDGLLPA